MKRYVEIDEFRRELVNRQITTFFFDDRARETCGKIIDVLDGMTPTTDVVSKEEYDKLKAEYDNLEYKLIGVMHSVDKWLDDEELEQDEVTRATTMREKTLQIIENLEKDDKAIRDEAVKEVARRIKTYYASPRYQRPSPHTYLSVLMHLIDTITRDMTGDVVLDYAELSPKRFTPEDVRNMSRQEVRENLKVILDSMDDWEGI